MAYLLVVDWLLYLGAGTATSTVVALLTLRQALLDANTFRVDELYDHRVLRLRCDLAVDENYKKQE